jgi:hypothetical protein
MVLKRPIANLGSPEEMCIVGGKSPHYLNEYNFINSNIELGSWLLIQILN